MKMQENDFTKKKNRKRFSVQFEDTLLEPAIDTTTTNTTSKEPKKKKRKNTEQNPNTAAKSEDQTINGVQVSYPQADSCVQSDKVQTNSPTKLSTKQKRYLKEPPNSATPKKSSPKSGAPIDAATELDMNMPNNTPVNSLEQLNVELVCDSSLDTLDQKDEEKVLPEKLRPTPAAVPKKLSKSIATSTKDLMEKYEVLRNEKLIERFMAVSINNNQKGRIRQVLRDLLKGTSDANLPDVIHGKIQSILKTKDDLTDTDLRKIRILYNMLKTAITAEGISMNSNKKENHAEPIEKEAKKQEKKDKVNKEQKVKGPKRYVVFVGNLPKDVTEEQITGHFSDLTADIASVRVPVPKEDKNSAIAFVELKDENSYEMALSKHHTMFNNKRIKVLYSTQKESKITKAEAKAKTSKLVAMVKSGQLRGSIPLKNKRSQRRARQKAANKLVARDTAAPNSMHTI